MAARPIWRGHLRLGLVSCPVGLWNAKHERNTIRFNLINPKTGNRIRMKTVDAETDVELERRDLMKGYEFRKNEYVMLTDSDFDSVKVESSSVIAIDKFVDVASIDPIYYASSYYLGPDGEAAQDVYVVLYRAISESGRMALARVVIGQRERTIAIRAMAGGLVAHTLDEQRDINDALPILGNVDEIQIDPEMVVLARQLVERRTATYDPADLEDRYETRLRQMIDAKLKGEGIDLVEPAVSADTKITDLMVAIKKSLEEAGKPAKAEKPATKALPPPKAKRNGATKSRPRA
jgi:DNA end-binding protein Ku